jgi:type II secretion system protein I
MFLKPFGLPENSRCCRGFSLLEVILALGILVGAMAVLGELARHGLDSARIARDSAMAQLLCESKLSEITAGLIRPEPASNVPFGTTSAPGEVDWLYSIELAETADQGLISVRVSVIQDLPPEKRPVEFSVVRWILDPNVEWSDESSEESEESSSTSSSADSSSTGGSR